jgi:hypothetical protein
MVVSGGFSRMERRQAMEGELWNETERIVREVGRDFQRKRVQYSDADIGLVYLWSVLHDRPVCWACQWENWPAERHPERIPCPSTMSVRLRSESVRTLLAAVESRLRTGFGTGWCKWIDGLPMPVGGSTHDPEARYGRGAGVMAKGYKLHAICDARGAFDAWAVASLNVNEQVVAGDLIPRLTGEGYLVGDGEYDANRLFDLAGRQGFQLIAPHQKGTQLGHRRHSPYRLRCRELLGRPFGQALLRSRYGIDRFFGQMGNFGGGLSPLPHWVRGLHRVRLWLEGKIILNAVRLSLNQRRAA